ncbi:hypothetical protein LXA43DRAFT_1104538 [Ganoderma leucocontextum]|nr:hypothetical protein LXA43DRAFT_1104535 [Ganoderma leucocontextum]KAI1782204.1 hypothetical protein LXA43DRAFT_1104538 [Ganoderma leucocontextum]
MSRLPSRPRGLRFALPLPFFSAGAVGLLTEIGHPPLRAARMGAAVPGAPVPHSQSSLDISVLARLWGCRTESLVRADQASMDHRHSGSFEQRESHRDVGISWRASSSSMPATKPRPREIGS